MKVWAIGGGKGGIGKSFVITNLAVTLAKQNKKVLIVDFDFGGANLHTCLGAHIPEKTLSDWFGGKIQNIAQLVAPTTLPNLQFISGANDLPTAADLKSEQIQDAINNLKNLPYDFLLLDLGAGTHLNTLSAFINAEKPIVTITPEPTSIENAYRFIKSAHYVLLKNLEKKYKLNKLISHIMDPASNFKIKTPAELLDKIVELNPKDGKAFSDEARKFCLHLVLNQARSMSDLDTAESVQTICKKFFGINTKLIGHIDHDNSVWQSVRKHRPVVLEQPYGQLVTVFNNLTKNLEKDEDIPGTKLLRTA